MSRFLIEYRLGVVLFSVFFIFPACKSRLSFFGTLKTDRGVIQGQLTAKENGFLEGFFEIPVQVGKGEEKNIQLSEAYFLTEENVVLSVDGVENIPAIVQPIATASSSVNRYFISFSNTDEIKSSKELELEILAPKAFKDTVKIILTPNFNRK